jgi:hypothetical protein
MLFSLRKFFNMTVNILRTVLGEMTPFFATDYTIQIVQHDERFLILKSYQREIAFDKQRKTVQLGAKILTTFGAIQTIDVKDVDGGDGPSVWEVSLCLSWRSKIRIGESLDAAEASVAAAHISTMTGKRVLSL